MRRRRGDSRASTGRAHKTRTDRSVRWLLGWSPAIRLSRWAGVCASAITATPSPWSMQSGTSGPCRWERRRRSRLAARTHNTCLAAPVSSRGGRFVGLEIREDLVEHVRARIAEAGLEQRIELYYANANTDLSRLFQPGQVARFVINFPDPWFKNRQHKRRLMTPALASSMVRCLEPGGELFFQSDVFELALDALAVLQAAADDTSFAGGFRNCHGSWRFARTNPYGVRSKREERPTARAGGCGGCCSASCEQPCP